MSSEEGQENPGDARDANWLKEPLGGNDFRIHVDVGEDVQLSGEARAALDTLLNELVLEEVSGFMPCIICTDLGDCNPIYECIPYGNCSYLSKNPCLADIWCRIGS